MALMNLALDISGSRTGAAWSDGGVPRFASYAAGGGIAGEVGKGRDYGRMAAGYEAWLLDLIATIRPGRIAFEAPMQVIKEQKPGERIKTNQATVIALFGLIVITDKVAFQQGIAVYQIHAGTARAAFTGNGHADKDAIMAQCKRLGWAPRNKDESDAGCVLWSMLALDPLWRPPVVRRAGMLV